MAIITISSGCFSHGKEIAEGVAQELKFECLSHEMLMKGASDLFHVPEGKLMETLHDAPTFLEKMTHAREKFLLLLRAALLEFVKRDRVVYHGYGGHLLVPEVNHVMKLRVIAGLEDRIALLQEKSNLSRQGAVDFIEEEDRERADWNRYFLRADLNDPNLYDLVLHIGKLKIQDACDIICTAAKSQTYKTTPESEKALHDFALATHVRAALYGICDADVTADNGKVRIAVKGQKLRKTGAAGAELQKQVQERIREDLTREILKSVKQIPSVHDVICDIDLPYYT